MGLQISSVFTFKCGGPAAVSGRDVGQRVDEDYQEGLVVSVMQRSQAEIYIICLKKSPHRMYTQSFKICFVFTQSTPFMGFLCKNSSNHKLTFLQSAAIPGLPLEKALKVLVCVDYIL